MSAENIAEGLSVGAKGARTKVLTAKSFKSKSCR